MLAGMSIEGGAGSGLEELSRRLADLYEAKREETRSTWDRDLPFDELLFDRWERARALGFGADSSIYHLSYVYGDVTVGEHTWIGPFTVLDGTGGLRIGAYCSISAGVHIYTHDTVAWAVSGGRAKARRAPVTIGDRCYIGSQVVIAQGVTIGDGAVIGAGAFVNRDIPPLSIAAGIPCRIIGEVRVSDAGEVALLFDSDT